LIEFLPRTESEVREVLASLVMIATDGLDISGELSTLRNHVADWLAPEGELDSWKDLFDAIETLIEIYRDYADIS